MAETVALIVAAGRGERAGGGVPKQFRVLAGKPVLRWAIEAFLGHGRIDGVQAVIHGDDVNSMRLQPPVLGSALPSQGARRARICPARAGGAGQSPPSVC